METSESCSRHAEWYGITESGECAAARARGRCGLQCIPFTRDAYHTFIKYSAVQPVGVAVCTALCAPPRPSLAEVTAVRPLSRHPVTRRHADRALAIPAAKEARPELEAKGQLGFTPSGCEAACRKHQLLTDLQPTLAHYKQDGKKRLRHDRA